MLTPTETADRIAAAKAKIKLTWYEEEIARRTRALTEILRDLQNDPAEPWKFEFASFDEYCRIRFNMTARRLRQITAADNIKALLAEDAPDISEQVNALNEGQTRVLATVPREQRADVLKAALAADKKKLTAAKIREAKAKAIEAEPTCTCATGSVGATQCPIHNPTEACEAVDKMISRLDKIDEKHPPAVQPGDGAIDPEHEQFYFDFTLPVNDDVIWFKSLTPACRLAAIARARQQP